jgi:hypothetical protein
MCSLCKSKFLLAHAAHTAYTSVMPQERQEPEVLRALTRDQLIEIIAELTDGQLAWWDLHDHTGLSEERCQTLAPICAAAVQYTYCV